MRKRVLIVGFQTTPQRFLGDKYKAKDYDKSK